MDYIEIREILEAISKTNSYDLDKAFISYITEIDDKSAIDEIYELYRENPSAGFLSNEIENIIEDMKDLGKIKEPVYYGDERDNLVDVFGYIKSNVKIKEEENDKGEKLEVAVFTFEGKDGYDRKLSTECYAYGNEIKAVRDFKDGDLVLLGGKFRINHSDDGKMTDMNLLIHSSELLKAKEQIEDIQADVNRLENVVGQFEYQINKLEKERADSKSLEKSLELTEDIANNRLKLNDIKAELLSRRRDLRISNIREGKGSILDHIKEAQKDKEESLFIPNDITKLNDRDISSLFSELMTTNTKDNPSTTARIEKFKAKEKRQEKPKYPDIRTMINEMAKENYDDLIKAFIGFEKSIDDENVLNEMYQVYMDNDALGLLNDEFDYMIDEMKEQGKIKNMGNYMEAKDDLINLTGKITGKVETIEKENDRGNKFEVSNFTLTSKDDKGSEIHTDCSAYGDKAKDVKDLNDGDSIKVFGEIRTSSDNDGKEHTNIRVLSTEILELTEQTKEKKEIIDKLESKISNLKYEIEELDKDRYFSDSFGQSIRLSDEIHDLRKELKGVETKLDDVRKGNKRSSVIKEERKSVLEQLKNFKNEIKDKPKREKQHNKGVER